jgi:predicted RNA-binding Zn-ribbon protein involved in translation (DUF1610 family)
MPVKFECPKCEKRFVQWGAEKLNFKCPSCEGEQLIRVGSGDDRPARKPTLRKRAKAEKAAVVPVVDAVDDEEVIEEPEEEEVVIGIAAKGPIKVTDDFDDDVVVDDEDAEISDEEDVPQDVEFVEEEGMGHIDLDEKL